MLLDKYASSREEGNKQFRMQRRAFELRICFLLHVALGWISLTGLNLSSGNTGRNHQIDRSSVTQTALEVLVCVMRTFLPFKDRKFCDEFTSSVSSEFVAIFVFFWFGIQQW